MQSGTLCSVTKHPKTIRHSRQGKDKHRQGELNSITVSCSNILGFGPITKFDMEGKAGKDRLRGVGTLDGDGIVSDGGVSTLTPDS